MPDDLFITTFLTGLCLLPTIYIGLYVIMRTGERASKGQQKSTERKKIDELFDSLVQRLLNLSREHKTQWLDQKNTEENTIQRAISIDNRLKDIAERHPQLKDRMRDVSQRGQQLNINQRQSTSNASTLLPAPDIIAKDQKEAPVVTKPRTKIEPKKEEEGLDPVLSKLLELEGTLESIQRFVIRSELALCRRITALEQKLAEDSSNVGKVVAEGLDELQEVMVNRKVFEELKRRLNLTENYIHSLDQYIFGRSERVGSSSRPHER